MSPLKRPLAPGPQPQTQTGGGERTGAGRSWPPSPGRLREGGGQRTRTSGSLTVNSISDAPLRRTHQ
eukprot:1060405-Pyramimonas_sp.AAC.1